MMFRTHVAFALLIGLVFLSRFNGNNFLFLLLVLVSANLADIDHPESKLGKRFWFLSKPFNFLFGHRRLFHSLLIPIILSLVIWWFFDDWWKPVFLGYVSHIFIDGFTLKGINFIYPLKQLRLSGFIETGKKQEMLLFWGFVVVDLLLLYRILF